MRIFCWHELVFPQSSIANHVRVMMFNSEQLGDNRSVYVNNNDVSQLSAAVAEPVLTGRLLVGCVTVISAGHMITGLIVSCTVMIWIHVLLFPQISVALHVRVSIRHKF